MAISFPSSPSTGQVFTSGNRSWTWDGSAWKGGVSSTGDATTLDGLDSTDFLRTNGGDVAITGRLSVGLTTAQSLPYYSNKLVLTASSQDGITIAANNTTATNYLMFADGTSGDARYRGYIEYNHNTENLALAQAAIHRLNFDNTGAVFNEAGNDYDFRVESDTVTHALFVRGNDGNVGIGLNAPDSPLHIKKTGANVTLLTLENYQSDIGGLSNQGNYIDFKMTDDNATATPQVRIGMHVYDSDGSDGGVPSEGNGNFLIYTMEGTDGLGNGNLTEKLRVTDKGNVGIGATNPRAMLEFGPNTTDNRYDIKAPADNARGIGLGNYTTFSTRYSSWDTLIGTNIRSKIGTSSSGEETASSYTASGGAGLRIGFQDLEFRTYSPAELSGLAIGSDVNSLGTTRFKVNANGNVGIGTNNPLQKLSVAGRVNVDQQSDYYGAWIDGNTTGDSWFAVGTWYSNGGRMTAGANEGQGLHLYTHNTAHQLTLQKSGGNVNIGGSAGSMKLNVNGDIYLGNNSSITNGLYGGGNVVVSSDNNVLIIGDGNTSSPSASAKITIGWGNTANINYDSLRGAALDSLNSPAVVTAEFYTDHAKMLKQLQLLNSSSNPSAPKTGAIYYNTTDDVVKVYSGTEWVDVGAPPMNASGGTVATYTVGGQSYRSHTFTSSGTFTPTVTGTVDVLVVAGGGCGGRDNAGGGGAGGLRTSTNVVVTPSSYTIVVGAGGAANTNDNGGNGGTGFNGANSSAIGITSLGGGFGGSAGTNNPSGQNRTSGGSGGGGAGAESTRSGGSGTAGQGNAGGPGHPSNGGGGGGGGAGAVGGSYSGTNDGGHGGIGVQNDYRTGSNVYYAGGGGAGNNNSVYTIQPGGSGGGGDGGSGGQAGSANTGGGGGGHTHPATIISGAGGSGIVVIRYPI